MHERNEDVACLADGARASAFAREHAERQAPSSYTHLGDR